MGDRTPYTAMIQSAARKYRLPFPELEAQILVESSGRADAFRYEDHFYRHNIVGNSRAAAARYGPLAACSYGLLQILLETAMERGFTGRPEQLFIPEIGLLWGAIHLRWLWDQLDEQQQGHDYRRVLAGYNAGLAAVQMAIANKLDLPASAYLERVANFVVV